MPAGVATVRRAYGAGDPRPTTWATTRRLSRVRACTRFSGPETSTTTRSVARLNPVNPEAAVVTTTPVKLRCSSGVTSPETRTSLGRTRTGPSRPVSIGTVWKNGPLTLAIVATTVTTESMAATLFAGPSSCAVLGSTASPWMRKPESACTVTRETTRTSLCAAESSVTSMSRGVISATRTSTPLGIGTSEGCTRQCHTDPENVSGSTLVITRGRERSFSSSPPLPLISTATAPGCCLIGRPGGPRTSSRSMSVWVTGCCAATATYSITAKNRAASLIGQLRRNSWPKLPAIEQRPYEGLVHRGVPLLGADDLLDDDAVAVDHEALWHARRLQRLADRPRAILQDVEVEAEVVHELHHNFRPVLIHAHGDDAEVAPLEVLAELLHRGHLEAAGVAPGRPDVEEHDLPAVVREGRGLAGARVHDAKVGSARAGSDQVELGAELDRERDAEHDGHRRARDQAPLARARHTVTKQRRRSSCTSRVGSALANTAFPATNVSAPAACAAAIVWREMPPSTSRNAREPRAFNSSRARRILSFEAGMYDCPPKPGLTVMMSSRSRSATTSSTIESDVLGLRASPAIMPRLLQCTRWRCACGDTSGWKVNTDAPASANRSM